MTAISVWSYCRHCGQKIEVGVGINRGVWIHIDSKSRYCDSSGTTRAAAR